MKRGLVFKRMNNKGMSLVTVIVAIGFVAILVSIIMMASAVNFKMKSVNVYSKDSFYTAEDVLDEINVGLQQVVSDALSTAYASVLEDYNADGGLSAEERNFRVRELYYKNLTEVLCPSGDTDHYVVQPVDLVGKKVNDEVDIENEGLYGLLRTSVRWDTDDLSGAFLRGGDNPATGDYYYGDMEIHEESGVVLKKLRVYYQDPNGFISTIETDIRLGYPSFTFASGDEIDVSSYTFITDTAFEVSGGTTAIKGKTYAYAMDTEKAEIDFEKWDGGKDIHIIPTDLSLSKGVLNTNYNSELWIGNIEANSSQINLSGNTYVYDDVNIKGRDSILKVDGRYVGFGDDIEDSEHSSALLINGVDTTINLSGAKRFELYGRAFINAGNSSGKYDVSDSNNDVYTGESIAIKSNQLMYLIPGKYLYVETDTSGNPVSSLVNKNPISEDELNNALLGKTYIEVSAVDPVSGDNLSEYVNIKADGVPEYEKVRLRGASGAVYYYYMKFKDEKAANDYFNVHFGADNKTTEYSYGKYMSRYVKSLRLPGDGLLISAHSVKSGTDGLELYAPSTDPTNADYDPNKASNNAFGSTADSHKMCETYTNQFIAYTSALNPDYESVVTADLLDRGKARKPFPVYDMKVNEFSVTAPSNENDSEYCAYYTVYKNLINDDVMDVFANIDELKDDGIIISKEDVTVGSSDHLVICAGDVTVKSNFKGTIIAKGRIKADPGVSFTADTELVDGCLLVETGDDVFTHVSDIFKDADETAFMTANSSMGQSISTSSLVTYENWTKDAGLR